MSKVHYNNMIFLRIFIKENATEQEVNHAPRFESEIPIIKVQVYERDLILKNISTFHYWSPIAKDNEQDKIKMEIVGD